MVAGGTASVPGTVMADGAVVEVVVGAAVVLDGGRGRAAVVGGAGPVVGGAGLVVGGTTVVAAEAREAAAPTAAIGRQRATRSSLRITEVSRWWAHPPVRFSAR